MTWEPKTSEVVAQSGGMARVLTTNRNLLIIADILVLNQGFAEQHPKMVEGIVRGLLEGNRWCGTLPKARWLWWLRRSSGPPTRPGPSCRRCISPTCRRTWPSSTAPSMRPAALAASTSRRVYAYGSDLIKDPADPTRFTDLSALGHPGQGRLFQGSEDRNRPDQDRRPGQRRDRSAAFEGHPLPVPAQFRQSGSLTGREYQESGGNQTIARRESGLDHSVAWPRRQFPGRGFPQEGWGEAFVRQMALKAVELSRDRAGEIQRLLIQKYSADPKRLDIVGRGWDEPAGPDPDLNRRVEVQWFTLE